MNWQLFVVPRCGGQLRVPEWPLTTVIQQAAHGVSLTVAGQPVTASFLMLWALHHQRTTVYGRWSMWNAGISAGRILTASKWQLVDDKRIARSRTTVNCRNRTSITVLFLYCTLCVFQLAVIGSFWMGLSFPVPEWSLTTIFLQRSLSSQSALFNWQLLPVCECCHHAYVIRVILLM